MSRKKILFFHFDLSGGGAEKVLVNLLNNIDKSKYEITLMTLFYGGENLQYLNKDIRYKYIFKRLFRGSTTLMKLFTPSFLYKRFIKEKYDLVVSFLENAPTRIVSGCPDSDTQLISWVHVEVASVSDFFKPYRSLIEAENCYNKFNRIVFVSDYAKETFMRLTQWSGISSCTLYNTIEVEKIKELSREKKDIVLDKNLINICTVGRLTGQKGYDRLLSVVRRLRNEGLANKFHLYIFGQGELLSEYESYNKINKIEELVTFCGYNLNPYKEIAQMDLFVCSSRKEGFSTAVTEAVILEVPILTTNCSGMSEILDNGKYGFIVENTEDEIYQGLNKILLDPAILYYYKQKVKERALFFNTKKTVVAVENLFDQCLKRIMNH